MRVFPFLALLALAGTPTAAQAQSMPRTEAEWKACFVRGGLFSRLSEDRARLLDLARRMDRADIERLLIRQRLDTVERQLDFLRGGYQPLPIPAPGFGGDYEFRRERDREREYEFRRGAPAPSPYPAPLPSPRPPPMPRPAPEPFCPDCPPGRGGFAPPSPAPGPIGYAPAPGYQQYTRPAGAWRPAYPGAREIRVEETRVPAHRR